jgi:2-polyprenyl-3-methyl-5-hydroxy-6-metoxy-1,4-benzoquinol methylase
MRDLSELAVNIELGEKGIWKTASSRSVSYPEQCSSECFEVEDNSFWFRHRNHCVTATIANLPPEGLILDVGGGNGFVSRALEASGFSPICLEPSMQGAVNAKQRGLEYVICSTLEEAAFKPHSIPAIGIFDVLEHVENEQEFLTHIKGVLCRGGRLYLTVPAGPKLWSNEDTLAGHYRRYTKAALSRALEQAGFKVKYQSHIFSFLVVPLFLCRILGGFLSRKRPRDHVIKRSEHQPSLPLVSQALSLLCTGERRLIASGKQIKIGTSLLVVAEAPSLPGGPS